MQKDAAEPSSSRSPYANGEGGGQRGAGGKVKRSFTRRQPSTPYDRPPTQDRRVRSQPGGGWISKLINPAYRLIASGATRVLPYVFSDSQSLLPTPPAPENDVDETPTRTQETRSDDQNITVNHINNQSTEAGNHSGREGNREGHGLTVKRQDQVPSIPRVTELSDIEKIIEQSTLRSEDICRLTKILHSKAVNVEQEQICGSASTSGKVNQANRASGKSRMEYEETPEDEGSEPEFSTPVLQPTVQDEVGLSPVEIAKAFMSSRASKQDTDSGGRTIQDQRPFSQIGEMTSNLVLASPTPRSSIRWPGAMLQEETGTLTPYTGRNTYGPIKHPRTPYSRAIYSESKSKLKPLGGDSRKPYISYSPFSQKGLPPYRQTNMTSAEDRHGSVGPMRSTRRKVASKYSVKESVPFWSSEKDSSNVKDWAHQDSSLLVKYMGNGPRHSPSSNMVDQRGNTEVGAFTSMVHPHTSKLARDILDQISRPPTIKEKSDEWKLVLARRKSDGDEASTMPNGSATTTSDDGKFVQDKEKGGLFRFQSQYTAVDNTSRPASSASDAALQRISRIFDGVASHTSTLPDSNSTLLGNSFQENSKNQVDDPLESKGLDQTSSNFHGVTNRSGSGSGSKPKLPPISVTKSNTGGKFVFNQSNSNTNTINPSFTFPTAPPSSLFSEPPTPSMMPVSSIVDNTVAPTFTFGDKKKSGPPLVFTFPSSSTSSVAPLPDDEPKFKFGSDKPRVSFASIGKDELCC